MKPEELLGLFKKIISEATMADQEINAAQWKQIDDKYGEIFFEESSKAWAKQSNGLPSG
jgi:hypothetical protein